MKIGIAGCTGRVGSILVNELLAGQYEELELAGGSTIEKGVTRDFFLTQDASELFEKSDAIIDFTLPSATVNHAKLAAEHKKSLIIGTTGLTHEDEEVLRVAAKDTCIVYAANMSVGVNILMNLVEKAAAALPPEDFDIEIFESHHKFKVDAPSGTALALGKSVATGRNHNLDDVAVYSREGITGTRDEGTIGFSVARGGDVVGEHTAYFYGMGERIELTHKATDRSLFAKGALRAAKWSAGKEPGLYSMQDVLGLS